MNSEIEVGVEKAKLLTEALPYIRDFHNKKIVVKFGSSVLKDKETLESVVEDVILLKLIGMEPIIVHSGSDEINRWLNNIGKNIQYVEDFRVTDEETMEIIEMVLGKINKYLVQIFAKKGAKAVGICGKDGETIKVEPKIIESADIGYFGSIKSINTDLIEDLISQDYIPIIASIGVSGDFTSYNLKADDVACAIAIALKAEKILFLSQDEGIKKNNDKSLHSMLTVSDAKNVVNSGRLNSEIAIKLNCAIHAVENGVPRAHILDGSVKHSVLLELFTVYGVGTAIVSDNKELYNHEKEYRK